MAVYNRQSNSSSAALPSQDLGSVIVQSLQNAVNSMKGNDVSSMDAFKDAIKQAIEESSLNASTEKTSKDLDQLLKDNTKAVSKNKPADKRDEEMLKLLKEQNDRGKKEAKDNVKAEKARAEKNNKNRHKDVMGKGGFGMVKVVGGSILKTILKIVVIVFLFMELIAAIKYGWKWLWGVKIPELITRFKLWFTGITTEIKTHIQNFFINIKNFFTNLWRPVAKFFGDKTFGMSDEDKKRAKEIEKDEAYKKFIEQQSDTLAKYTEIQEQTTGMFKTLKTYTGIDAGMYIDEDELKQAIESGNANTAYSTVRPLMEVIKKQIEAGVKDGSITKMTDEITGVVSYSGGNSGQLVGALDRLENYFGKLDPNEYAEQQRNKRSGDIWLRDINDTFKNLEGTEGYKLWKELQKLYAKALEGEALINVEEAVKDALVEKYKDMLKKGEITSATDKTMSEDEYYGSIVTEAKSSLPANLITYQKNEALEWIQTTGDRWINTFKETMNDLLQNVGVKADIRLEYSNHGQDAWKASPGGAKGV